MLLSRVNVIREEPGGANGLLVVDMNGPLYILDKRTQQVPEVLRLDGREDRPDACSIGSSSRADTVTASTDSISIPTTGGTASSTRYIWKTRT